uniref:Uncharacterized protein n=1 Tax=Triticum urartu TaxID=4572 RepID=A0A8R7UVA2_TRIUA
APQFWSHLPVTNPSPLLIPLLPTNPSRQSSPRPRRFFSRPPPPPPPPPTSWADPSALSQDVSPVLHEREG